MPADKQAAPQKPIDFEFDVEADRRAAALADEKLANMGVRDAEDLGPGRADVGLVSKHLNRTDADTTAEDMEEAKRLKEWEQESQAPFPKPPQAAREPQPEVPADPLVQLQVERDAALLEAKRMKEQYARESERWGSERKRVAERLARLEQAGGVQSVSAQPAPAASYDPRMLGGADPDAPLTASQTAILLNSMAAAFGQQLNVREQSIIEAARGLRDYDLTDNEEADLIERHGWLATLDRASQIKAMRDLVQPLRAASQPAAGTPPKPRSVNMEDLARAKHLTATTFIESSSHGSTQERQAATGADSALARKIAEYNQAKSLRPGMQGYEAGQYGENAKAERLLREIGVLQRRRA